MQLPCDSDEEALASSLVSRIRNGEREAETELVEVYRNGLCYQLKRLSGDAALRDDLFQDTLKVVLEKVRAGQLRQPEKLAGFIRKTAQNLYIAHYRKKVRRGAADERAKANPPHPGPTDAQSLLERQQEAELVRRVIRQLGTERDRKILFRFYVAQEDKQTICNDLGIDPQIFNRLLYRARQRFKQLWNTRTNGSTGLVSLLLLTSW